MSGNETPGSFSYDLSQYFVIYSVCASYGGLYEHSERTTQLPYNLPMFVIAEHQVQTSTKMPLSMQVHYQSLLELKRQL